MDDYYLLILQEKATALVLMQRQGAWRLTEILENGGGTLSLDIEFEVDHLALYLVESVIRASTQLPLTQKNELINRLLTSYAEFSQQIAGAALKGLSGLAFRFVSKNTDFGAQTLLTRYKAFRKIYDDFLASQYRKDELSDVDDLNALFFLFVQRVRHGHAGASTTDRPQLGKPEIDAFFKQMVEYFIEIVSFFQRINPHMATQAAEESNGGLYQQTGKEGSNVEPKAQGVGRCPHCGGRGTGGVCWSCRRRW